MDAAIVIAGGTATCRKLREIRKGDAIVCGVRGIKIVPQFQERDRLGFAFMPHLALIAKSQFSRLNSQTLRRHTHFRDPET